MTDKLLDTLIKKLDAPQSTYAGLDAYYAGMQPLSFLSPEAKLALGNRLHRVSVNVPRLLVEAVAERLRVVGFDGADVWPTWLATDMDQESGIVHREALTLGTSYVAVWGAQDGSPLIAAESAKQVAVLLDPGTRRVIAAVKRWATDATTEATLWQPEQVTRLRANTTGATTGGLRVVDTLDNPLGTVPIVPFTNTSRLLDDDGRSEMADVLSLTDALVKITTDALVASEYTARPRRFAVGIELELDEATGETVNPIPEGDRAMVSENHEAKFGQLPGADLAGYETMIRTLVQEISAVTGLPPHMLGQQGDNPTSADSIRASEAALTARAEARQSAFGRSWEQVGRLAVAVRDKVSVDSVDVRVRWADAATRSTAQEADAAVKLVQAGVLPASYALRKLGYSEDQVAEIRTARRAEALDALPLQGVLTNGNR